ncbi:putative 3-hydroxyacyl-CoA dehydrogenase [Halobellus salinus]|uniref:Putative 3-hydroxyacyl-CoA dehydrogenase n=1 Tax=Halobellus salinus TaxID=931585 RepID=A0A830E8G1_9EURY|nr:3-hydroxyacyl-CoA dehydrogenase family protein [Halobellus salinus]GGJ00378.1 putative 3-hydroxyacyl-CoA dehydrogenase [Halobellus salinus]SMP01596.1 3-hydroxyacyl-CoA dehydrogenase [Halobellus salinus]
MQVTVLGAGTMGHGIAQVSAMAGHDVTLRDIEPEIVDEGVDSIRSNLEGGVERGKVTEAEMDSALGNITGETDLPTAIGGADLVAEAVPEDLGLKTTVLTDAEDVASEETILATNTSSLSVTELASGLERPGNLIGLHFFNPVHIMSLVEVIVGERTDESTRAFATEFVEAIDKTPVVVRDVPGFASSRLGVALGVEAIRMVEEGVAAPRDIDNAMELGYNHPIGPLELTDVVGLDVRLDILEYLRTELGERFTPPQLLKRKVRAGKLGKKSGEGFYVWEDGEAVATSGEWSDR